MIINKVQPEFVFNTTDESFESLAGEVFTIEDIKTVNNHFNTVFRN
jgi:D-alanine--poly(phosphoribitol) ligase subunit 1